MSPAGAAILPGFFFAAKGRGILIGLIAGVCPLLCDWLTGMHFHDSAYYAHHGWPKMAAFFTAAFIIWLLDRRSDETIEGSELAAKPPFFTGRDTFFWIPAQYWPGILCLLGIVLYFFQD